MGSARRVQTSVMRMCAAKTNAQPTVSHSPRSKWSCGGPPMKAAPAVASTAPKSSAGWGILRLRTMLSKAVNST